MPRIVMSLTEEEANQELAAAVAADRDAVFDPRRVRGLMWRAFRFQEIEKHIISAGLCVSSRRVAYTVSRLIGVHEALKAFAQGSGTVPKQVYDLCAGELGRWQDWASQQVQSMVSDADMRDEIDRDLNEGDRWRSWAMRMLNLEELVDRTEQNLRDELEVLLAERDQLVEWQQWADKLAPKCTSAHEQRESIGMRWRSG